MDLARRCLLILSLAGLAAGADLEALFIRADRDPAALAPLLREASAALLASPADQGLALAERLAPYCRRAFTSPERFPGQDQLGLTLHVVQGGELPGRIAKRYRVGAGMLARLNQGYAPTALRIGQQLKVLDLAREPLQLVVSIAHYRLFAWRGPLLVGCFPVGLGAAGKPTPTGATTIAARVRDPEWTNPDTGRVLAPKDPLNILGGYWLGFAPGPDGRFKGIGMHGYTGEPAERWIEKPGSHGCVRMLQGDIGAVFDLGLEGTAVVIR